MPGIIGQKDPYGVALVVRKIEDLDKKREQGVIGGRHLAFFEVYAGKKSEMPPRAKSRAVRTVGFHSSPALDRALERFFEKRKEKRKSFGHIVFNVQKASKGAWVEWYPFSWGPKGLRKIIEGRGVVSRLELFALQYLKKRFRIPKSAYFAHHLEAGAGRRKKSLEDRHGRPFEYEVTDYVNYHGETRAIRDQLARWKNPNVDYGKPGSVFRKKTLAKRRPRG